MNVLNKILQAREGRFALRKRFASEGRASLSLSLNIPGYPKTTPGISWFFKKATVDLQRFLTAHRVGTYPKDAVDHPDEAGDFFIVPLKKNSLSLREIKHICETFEESHPVGRVIDVDVTGPDMENISSGKAKTCFICKSTPAIQCMRENTHTKEELRKYIFAQIVYYVEKYREKDTCRKLATFALKAVLYEVSLSPKP
ncbi:MAG: hypothetical protein GY765_12755, partial [bacterium]|nr:hypothetical protein [bacterium]